VSFIKQNAWFDFDFLTPFKALWLDTGLWGDKPFRKWERKYMLTSEYLAKAAYGWALGKASRATYDDTSERTYAVVNGYSAEMAREGAKLEQHGARESLISLPRYQAFTTAADALALHGVNFHEIAGNRGAILVTVVTPDGILPQTGGRLIYSQPILTRPGETRYAIAYEVPNLAAALRRYAKASVRVEHIYDY
jgi:hypothetical protein